MPSHLCTYQVIFTCLDLNYLTWSEVHIGGRLDLGEAGHSGGVRGEEVSWAVGRETILDLGIIRSSLCS